jgi:hypothetical protein
MLSQEMLIPIGIFALLESECVQVWLLDNQRLIGIEPADDAKDVAGSLSRRNIRVLRVFRYGGTAGDRNVHVRSGRTE